MVDHAGEHEFPSTHWLSQLGKITPTPEGQSTARRSRSPFRKLARVGRHRSQLVELSWVGGSNAYWLVRARGVSQVVPGIICLEDLMSLVRNDWPRPAHVEAWERKRSADRERRRIEAATQMGTST